MIGVQTGYLLYHLSKAFVVYLIFTTRCTSAQRGIKIACHPSVNPSVTLVLGGSGSHRLEILQTSLFAAQRPSTYFYGNVGKFGGD